MERYTLNKRSNKRVEIIDITKDLNDILAKCEIKEGIVNIFAKHSTAGIVINENESGLVKDFQNSLESLIPTGNNYLHDRIDNNADSHIRSFFIGSSETIPMENGSLSLGTWQSVFFVELDGPRSRKFVVTIIGEWITSKIFLLFSLKSRVILRINNSQSWFILNKYFIKWNKKISLKDSFKWFKHDWIINLRKFHGIFTIMVF